MPVTRDEVIWAYRLLLGRPPESEEVITDHMNSENTTALRRTFMQSSEFGSQLAEIHKTTVPAAPPSGTGIDPAAALDELAHSEEFRKKMLAAFAPELVKAAYMVLLQREPDEEGLASYITFISETMDLPSFFADIVQSDEYRQKLTQLLSRELVKQIYIGLLKREPDEEGLAAYSEGMVEPRDISRIMDDVLSSSEFAARYSDARNHLDPDENYDKPGIVFIHIRKTAGTSIQRHLHDHFSEAEYYRENEDRLHRYSPSQLSGYNLYAGHFSYDSIRYIPRRNIGIFTFVREPQSRLLSQYYFYRAYEPSNRLYAEKEDFANRLSAEEFFENSDIRASSHFWNNMCWAVMGQRKWREWQSTLAAEKDPGARAELVETGFRPTIAKRLGEFFFIGMQEDFDRSVKLLFQLLKLPPPREIRTDNKLELLLQEPHFKKTMEKQPVTERLNAALDGLVQLDNVVYQEAKKLYERRLAESNSLQPPLLDRAGQTGGPAECNYFRGPQL